MTTDLSHTRGAVSPTRIHQCRKGLRPGAWLLGLQLAAGAPPAWSEADLNRLVFEAHPLPETPVSLQAPVALQAPVQQATPGITLLPTGTLPVLPATANPSAAGSLLTEITELNQRIVTLEETEGAFAPQLVQEYLDLGRRYQSLNRHEAAIEAFEDAEHLSRITAGLQNPALIAVIEASLPSHLALGELRELGYKQQSLYELTRTLYGSSSNELVPLLDRLGDWQVSSFRRSLQRQPVVSISFGGGRSPDPRQASFGSLLRAQRHYSEAITNLLQRQDLNAPELFALEQKFVQTLYLAANRNGLLDNPDFYLNSSRTTLGSRVRHREMQGHSPNFVNGRSAYQRMRIYARLRQQPLAEQASLLLAEADWHLLFRHNARALQLYAEAFALLQSDAVSPAERQALLTPALPLQLPAFMALPHSRAHFGLPADARLQWEGWVDVSFELSRYGKPVQLQMLDSSAGTEKAVQSRLRRLLMASPFRPRIEAAGQDADSEAAAHVYRLRYYYASADAAVGSSEALGVP
jgi:tetratricopeptide (TPR) repeat protein